MLTSRQPIWIGWGPELLYLYNDPYKSIIGGKHPWALGRPTAEVWREIWDEIGPLLRDRHAAATRAPTPRPQLLIMERNGYPEETYYTFSYSPVPNDDGTVGGIICANTDDTPAGDRRAPDGPAARARRRRDRMPAPAQEACTRSAAALGDRCARPAVRAHLPGRTRMATRSQPRGGHGHRSRPCRAHRSVLALDAARASGRRGSPARSRAERCSSSCAT